MTATAGGRSGSRRGEAIACLPRRAPVLETYSLQTVCDAGAGCTVTLAQPGWRWRRRALVAGRLTPLAVSLIADRVDTLHLACSSSGWPEAPSQTSGMNCRKLPAACLAALLLAAAAGSWADQQTECGERGCAAAGTAAVADPAASALPTVHTVVATDCTMYFTWWVQESAAGAGASGGRPAQLARPPAQLLPQHSCALPPAAASAAATCRHLTARLPCPRAGRQSGWRSATGAPACRGR